MSKELLTVLLARQPAVADYKNKKKESSAGFLQFIRRHKRLVMGMIVFVMVIGAQAYTLVHLNAVEHSRLKFNEKMRLYTKKHGMRYILRNDDFERRKQFIFYTYIGVNIFSIIFIVLFIMIIKSYQRLENEKRTKSEMISMITHNARHFLSVIDARLDLLKLREELRTKSDKVERDFDLIMINLQSIDRLVDNLNENEVLDHYEVHLQPLLLSKVLNDAVDNQRELAKEKNVDIQMAHQDGMILLADRQLLNQALLNIIHNAVKFTEIHTTIVVSAVEKDGQAIIDIKDSGPGIPVFHHQNIFNPYTRLNPVIRGTGLGLGNAKKCMQLMNGSLVLKASSPGKGSVFRLVCPLVPEE